MLKPYLEPSTLRTLLSPKLPAGTSSHLHGRTITIGTGPQRPGYCFIITLHGQFFKIIRKRPVSKIVGAVFGAIKILGPSTFGKRASVNIRWIESIQRPSLLSKPIYLGELCFRREEYIILHEFPFAQVCDWNAHIAKST